MKRIDAVVSSDTTPERTQTPPAGGRAWSAVMALIIGFAGIPLIAFYAHWYEAVLIWECRVGQVIVNALTPSVLFLFLLLVLVINPLLRLLSRSLALRTPDLFMVLALWLLAGSICYVNLTTPILSSIGNLNYQSTLNPNIKKSGVKEYLNPRLYLPEAAARVYYQGLSPDGKTRIDALPRFGTPEDGTAGPAAAVAAPALPSVPWGLWVRPLAFWVPLILVIVVFSSSLVRTVHRQWSQHELLTYPLAAVIGSLFGTSQKGRLPDIFYSKKFWIGFAIAAFIYIINGLWSHFKLMIDIPMLFSHTELIKEFNFLSKYCGSEAYALFRGYIYLFVICIAVLLPVELSLTSWLGWVLMIFGTGVYFQFTGVKITGNETMNIQYGMYVAMGLAILVIGRREYVNILRCAFRFRRAADPALAGAARACRVFLLSSVALWALFVVAGLDRFIALVLVGSFALVVLLIARLTAETGIPWLPNFMGMASMMPLKLLGAATLGPQAIAVLAAMSMALDYNTTNTVAAQETTLAKLREGQKRWAGGAGFNCVLAVGVLLAVLSCIFFTLRDNYSFGARQEAIDKSFSQVLMDAGTEISRLKMETATGEFKESAGLAKLRQFKFDPTVWRFFALGAAMVAICALMRARFVWWPFHPLPLLFVNTWTMSRLYFSILLGWLIKVAILKIGGGKTFTGLKPLFVGIIAGQVAVYGLWLVINGIYSAVTGSPPPIIEGFYYGH